MILGLAKRQVGKHKSDFNAKHFYDKYIENIEKNTIYHVSKPTHTNILKDFNTEIMKLIIEKSFEYVLPFRMGALRIKNKKTQLLLDDKGELITRKLTVNYKATRELWNSDIESYNKRKLIFYTNEHSDENKAFFYWNKKKMNFKNSYYKSFIPSRVNKRWLAATIKNPDLKVKYYE